MYAITSILNGTASDANFRSFCQSVNAAMVAAGWVQTADTGQVNNSTVTNPAASGYWSPGYWAGGAYEIWRMNDALQSTYPVFLKIEYYNAVANNTHALQIQMSLAATDGAGNLASPKSQQWGLENNNSGVPGGAIG